MGGRNGICAPCTWLTEVQATMKSVTQVQMQLQIDAMGDGGSYAGVAAVVQDTVGITNVFQEDLENYNKWKEDKEKSHIILSNEIKTETNTLAAVTTTTPLSESTAPSKPKTAEENKTATDIDVKKKKDRANKNIGTQLRLMQKTIVMEVELLQEIKLSIIPKVTDWLLKLKLLLDELLKRKVKLIEQISDDEKIMFAT